MTPYNRFINERYIRLFNSYLKSVCEPLFYEKYKKKVKLKLYGIGIKPKSSVYDGIPKEELLDSQAIVSFFIDTEPSHLRTNFFEELIIDRGKSILQLKNSSELGYYPEKFRLKVHFNNRPLFELDYVADENSINENNLPFLQKEKNGIKRRTFNEKIDSEELKWHFDDNDRKVKIIESNGWQFQMDNDIPKKLKKGDTFFIPKGMYHRVIKGKGDLVVEIKEMEDDLLVERNKSQLRNVIRTVVKDIVQIYKENNEGNFYLPEDLDEENMFYEFTDLPIPISFEVNLKPNKKIKDFKLNGEYWRNEDTISISIQYNPDGKEKHIYNLIGELNEIVGHELRHVYQKIKNTYDLEGEEEEDPFKYYTQPEEIDAQVFGFKRMSRMTKKPVETIMVNWFKKNKDIHNLNVDEVKKVIKILKENL